MAHRAEYSGSFEQRALHEAVCRLAGRLAESGCLSVRLRLDEGHPRVLAARETDLPGELSRLLLTGAGAATLELAAVVTGEDAQTLTWLRPNGTEIRWTTTSARIAEALA